MNRLKIILVLTLLAGCWSAASAQETTALQRDSLFASVRNMPDDSLKVRRLNELAIIATRNAPQIALLYAESAVALSDEIHDERGRIMAYTNLGVISQFLGQMDQAIESFSRALQLSGNNPAYKRLRTTLLRAMGSFFLDQFDLPTARQYTERSLGLARETGDSLGVALALNGLSLVEQQSGNIDAAIQLSRKAAAIFEGTGNLDQATLVYTSLGGQLTSLRRYDEALTFCNKALGIQQKNNDLRGSANTLRTISAVQSAKNQPDEALKTALQAEALLRKVDNSVSLAASLTQVGTLFLQKGVLKECLPRFENAKSIYQSIDNQEMQSEATLNIARAYRLKKDFERALLETSNALVQASSLEAFDIVVYGETLAADILADQKRYDEALERLERCKALFVQRKAKQEAHPEMYESLYQLYEKMGKTEQAADAKALWEKLKTL